jgi:hypothetical protein
VKLNLSKCLWALAKDIQRLKVVSHNPSSARLLGGSSQHALTILNSPSSEQKYMDNFKRQNLFFSIPFA